MRLTRTVKISYLIGLSIITVGLIAFAYNANRAEWEYPELKNMPFEYWAPAMQELGQERIYPYQILGLLIVTFGATTFIVTPTLISQIAKEVQS